MRSGIFIQSGLRGMDREVALKKIAKFLPYSLVLFKSDFSSQEDLKELIRRIRKIYVTENGVEEPVIAVDQEGGNVVRLDWLDYNPSNLFLGEFNNTNFTSYVASLTGYQLSDLGIHWNLAPVLDLLNPYNQVILERSFGSDIKKVSDHGSAYIKGLQSHGVHATAKHFPGHGSVMDDSHLVLPSDKRGFEAIINDAYPFISAIEAGVHSVMLSHVLYTSLDPDFPASISPSIQNLLRDRFKFDGLIITDSIEMKALSDNFSKKEIVDQTILHHVDLIESADLDNSIELADIISKVDYEKFEEKMRRLQIFQKSISKSRYRPMPDLLNAVEMTFPVVRRNVRLDPSRQIDMIFLDISEESIVTDHNYPITRVLEELDHPGFDIRFHYGLGSIDTLENSNQVIFVGRNEHLKNRVWKINEFCKGRKCAFISTSVDRDVGVIDPSIGYVSAFSQKSSTITGAVIKILGDL